MITPFDIFVFLGILLAMLLCSQPKRSAIAFIAIISLSIILIDSFAGGWFPYYAASILEGIGAIALFNTVAVVEKYKDRHFFRLMGSMLLFSAFTVPLFKIGIIAHTEYVTVSHLIAAVHVGIMLGLADGTRNLARILHDDHFGNWRGPFHS